MLYITLLTEICEPCFQKTSEADGKPAAYGFAVTSRAHISHVIRWQEFAMLWYWWPLFDKRKELPLSFRKLQQQLRCEKKTSAVANCSQKTWIKSFSTSSTNATTKGGDHGRCEGSNISKLCSPDVLPMIKEVNAGGTGIWQEVRPMIKRKESRNNMLGRKQFSHNVTVLWLLSLVVMRFCFSYRPTGSVRQSQSAERCRHLASQSPTHVFSFVLSFDCVSLI